MRGRQFANRNQTHACARHELESHFAGRPPKVRDLYDAFVATVRSVGPVTILPEKTRIAFQVRMSFAQVTPRRGWLDGHLVLDRRVDDPHFRRIERMSPRSYVHHFRIAELAEIDDEFATLLRAAYAVGEQKHLDR